MADHVHTCEEIARWITRCCQLAAHAAIAESRAERAERRAAEIEADLNRALEGIVGGG